jgi:hypothetical protein
MKERELRLALVCYGGISLAVYMHGITKEIWRLARASRGFHDGSTSGNSSEAVYRKLLEDLEAASGVRLRVMPILLRARVRAASTASSWRKLLKQASRWSR